MASRHLLLALALGLSQPSFAAVVALQYEPAPELNCPNETALRRLVAAKLGSDPFTDNADSLVTVRIKAGTPIFADVILESPRGAQPRRKSLSGTDCASLLNSIAVTVALTIDPIVRRPEEPKAPVVAPATPVHLPEPEVWEPAAPPPSQAPPLVVDANVAHPPVKPQPKPIEPSTPLRASISVGASANLGMSVVAQPTLRLEGRLHGTVFSLGLEGRYGWPVYTPLSNGTLTTSLLMGGVVPCLTYKWFSGCADVSAGALRLEGSELTDAKSQAVFHASVGLRALMAFPIANHFSLGLMVEGQVPLTRASALVGSARVWTVSPLGGGLGAWAIFLL